MKKEKTVLIITVLSLICILLMACTVVDDPITADNGNTNTQKITTASGVTEAVVSTGDGTSTASSDVTTSPVGIEEPKVYVKFFKCGKADSFLIRTENKSVLIDTGEDDDYDKILEYLAEKGISKLDYVIITQFNKNHTGSIGTIFSGVDDGVLKLPGVDAETILEPSYIKSSPSYTRYTQALTAAGKTAEKVSEIKTIDIDGATLTIYPCEVNYTGTDFDEYNSFVITLSYKGNEVLFSGDVFGARITEVMGKLSGKVFDIVKVPNHGIYDTKSEAFINSVSADYAIITASDKNPADTRVVSYLEAAGAQKVYITKDGSVELRLGNGYYQIKQNETEWIKVNK